MKISGVANCDAYSISGVDEPDISTISETVLATCPAYVTPTVDPASSDTTIDGDTPATVTIQDGRRNYTWTVVGTGASIIPNGESVLPSAIVSYDADFDCCAVVKTDITVTVTDDYGNPVVYVITNIEPVVPVPTINAAATDDTIDNATPATVTIVDGCPPFTWAVSGTGYTIDPNGSSALRAAVVSVAAGTCGVNYAATCTVTVTDACDNLVTKEIRHTAGVWHLYAESVGASPTYVNCGQYPGDLYEEFTSGLKHWKILHRYCMKDYAPTSAWTKAGWDQAWNPPCGLPNACVKLGVCTGTGCAYYADYLWYYDTWSCP